MVAAGVAASAMPHVLFNERGQEEEQAGLGVLKRPTKLVEHHRVASRVACKKMTAATSETATENSGKCSAEKLWENQVKFAAKCQHFALCTFWLNKNLN